MYSMSGLCVFLRNTNFIIFLFIDSAGVAVSDGQIHELTSDSADAAANILKSRFRTTGTIDFAEVDTESPMFKAFHDAEKLQSLSLVEGNTLARFRRGTHGELLSQKPM